MHAKALSPIPDLDEENVGLDYDAIDICAFRDKIVKKLEAEV